VINYGGWQADLLDETGAGLVLDPQDPTESAAKLVRFLSDPASLERALEASRRLGDRVFNRRKLVLQLENVFRGVAE
jgi:UDP-N-acetylglucosamine:LPS N-acetylglucosamine transferase